MFNYELILLRVSLLYDLLTTAIGPSKCKRNLRNKTGVLTDT